MVWYITVRYGMACQAVQSRTCPSNETKRGSEARWPRWPVGPGGQVAQVASESRWPGGNSTQEQRGDKGGKSSGQQEPKNDLTVKNPRMV